VQGVISVAEAIRVSASLVQKILYSLQVGSGTKADHDSVVRSAHLFE